MFNWIKRKVKKPEYMVWIKEGEDQCQVVDHDGKVYIEKCIFLDLELKPSNCNTLKDYAKCTISECPLNYCGIKCTYRNVKIPTRYENMRNKEFFKIIKKGLLG